MNISEANDCENSSRKSPRFNRLITLAVLDTALAPAMSFWAITAFHPVWQACTRHLHRELQRQVHTIVGSALAHQPEGGREIIGTWGCLSIQQAGPFTGQRNRPQHSPRKWPEKLNFPHHTWLGFTGTFTRDCANFIGQVGRQRRHPKHRQKKGRVCTLPS